MPKDPLELGERPGRSGGCARAVCAISTSKPQGDAMFMASFEHLEDDEMAKRLYHRLVAHDAQCTAM
ncbi:hypothetical protein WME89_48945 [Sorangium sp. So ce321]|uniref:hypothetical protein n=1 Tax=Sorangium sp. So ce321 TaxID=3133300 RepID=UPI003F629E8A